MAVKLSILQSDRSDAYHQTWWINFIREEVGIVPGSVPNIVPHLAKWGGKNCPGPWIEFENDENATAFLLRWS